MTIRRHSAALALILLLTSALMAAPRVCGQQPPAEAAPPAEAEPPAAQPVPAEQQEAADPAAADDAAPPKIKAESAEFMRILHDRNGRPVALQTSVTRFETTGPDNTPVSVDLIGVVHIGDKSYYERLNEIFKGYDALLYELVAPEGARPLPGDAEGGLNPVAALQKGMQAMLGLEFQLDHIDYSAENFFHADMSPDEFLQSMEANNESFLKMALRAVGQSMAMQNPETMNDFDLLMALMADDRTVRLRRVMAEQMLSMDTAMVIFEGDEGSTIIHRRNGKALDTMHAQIDAGKRKLAIFFGAGHLPDMQERLVNEFKMRKAGRYWLSAWPLDSDR